jgi:hypothetical protein
MNGENLIFVLQKYLMCEGRYVNNISISHTIVTSFFSRSKVNFPYFLWKSLRKMSQKVQKTLQTLIAVFIIMVSSKLLIEDELNLRHDSWANFLVRNGFIPVVGVHHKPQERKEFITL